MLIKLFLSNCKNYCRCLSTVLSTILELLFCLNIHWFIIYNIFITTNLPFRRWDHLRQYQCNYLVAFFAHRRWSLWLHALFPPMPSSTDAPRYNGSVTVLQKCPERAHIPLVHFQAGVKKLSNTIEFFSTYWCDLLLLLLWTAQI